MGLRPSFGAARPTRPASGLVEIHGMPVLSRCGALTTRLSRTRFAPPTTWQVKLATWSAPLRTPAQLRRYTVVVNDFSVGCNAIF